jgi:hypothetical protein
VSKRKAAQATRTDICWTITRALRTFGYPDLQNETVKGALDAWLEGKRGHDIPGGVIGYMAGREFDALDGAMPGALARLVNA